eukprot:866138_1
MTLHHQPTHNSQVLLWWIDQITAYLGLIICSVLCIIVIKTVRSHELPSRLRCLIYTVHIFSVLFFIATISTLTILPFFNALNIVVNQSTACYFTYAALSCTGAILLLSIINLFFERLYLSFQSTDLALSPCCNIGFRVIICTIWIGLGFTYLFVSDPTPYDIYHQRIDTTNGITCSTHAKGVDNMMTIVYELIAAMISITNLIVWVLFISKLYALLKQMKVSNVTDVSADFIVIMKHQTMLVGIAVFSSVVLWTLEATLQIGQIFASLDFIVTVFICFLTFKFNEKYFILLKCDVLSGFCCKWFERMINGEHLPTVTELKTAQCVSVSSDGTDGCKSSVKTGSRDRCVTLSVEQSEAASQPPSVSIDVILHDYQE